MKKVIILFVAILSLLAAGLIIESCCKCEELPPSEYSFSSFEIHPMDNKAIMSAMEGYVGAGGADENPFVFRKDFGVAIEFIAYDVNMLANCRHAGSFFPSAYACECPGSILYPKDSIVSIQVFSDKDFDETHLAGADIAEFFQIREWDSHTSSPWLTSFESYFKRPAPVFYEGGFYWWITCLLTATNLKSGEYEFHFVVRLSDKRTLEQSVKAVLQ